MAATLRLRAGGSRSYCGLSARSLAAAVVLLSALRPIVAAIAAVLPTVATVVMAVPPIAAQILPLFPHSGGIALVAFVAELVPVVGEVPPVPPDVAALGPQFPGILPRFGPAAVSLLRGGGRRREREPEGRAHPHGESHRCHPCIGFRE
jgi:hypothetical protein